MVSMSSTVALTPQFIRPTKHHFVHRKGMSFVFVSCGSIKLENILSMSYPFLLTGPARTEASDGARVGEAGQTPGPASTAGGNYNGAAIWVPGSSPRVKQGVTLGAADSIHQLKPKHAHLYAKVCTHMLIADKWGRPKCPSMDERVAKRALSI